MFEAPWIQTEGSAEAPVYAIVTPVRSMTAGHDGFWLICHSLDTVNGALALIRSPHWIPAVAAMSCEAVETDTWRDGVNAGRVWL